MSARGFLLRMPDDDLYDPEMRPISPNIIISRSDFFAAQAEGKTAASSLQIRKSNLNTTTIMQTKLN